MLRNTLLFSSDALSFIFIHCPIVPLSHCLQKHMNKDKRPLLSNPARPGLSSQVEFVGPLFDLYFFLFKQRERERERKEWCAIQRSPKVVEKWFAYKRFIELLAFYFSHCGVVVLICFGPQSEWFAKVTQIFLRAQPRGLDLLIGKRSPQTTKKTKAVG